MAFKAACFLTFQILFGLAIAVLKRDNSGRSISQPADVPESSSGFSVTTNLNLPNPVNASGKVYNADGSYNVTTGYISYVMCNNTQISQLLQAVNDAVSLVAESLSKGELKRDASGTVDFTSQAAIDYFGPPGLNQPFQSNIQSKQCLSSMVTPLAC